MKKIISVLVAICIVMMYTVTAYGNDEDQKYATDNYWIKEAKVVNEDTGNTGSNMDNNTSDSKESSKEQLEVDGIRKTAEDLTEEDTTEVTLAIPSDKADRPCDIVFVVDTSTCLDDTTSEWSELIKSLEGKNVNACTVYFRGQAQNSGFVNLKTEGYDAFVEKSNQCLENIKSWANSDPDHNKGSNLHSGLLMANELLAQDTNVKNSRKYVVVLTDGITYSWNQDGKQVGINWATSDGGNYYPSNSSWEVMHGSYDYHPNWDSFFDTSLDRINKSMEYVAEYTRNTAENEGHPVVTPDMVKNEGYADSVETALYMCMLEYRKLQNAGYNCYAIPVEGEGRQYGQYFIEWLGEGKTFDDIENDVLWYVSKGTRIIDKIGYEKGKYDFTMTGKMKVVNGDKVYEAEKIGNDQYGFGKCADGYLYEVEYIPGEGEDECFEWKINCDVSNFDSVQLKYELKLDLLDKSAGKHVMYTNIEAELFPKDSDGNNGEPQKFERPTVEKTIVEPQPPTPTPVPVPDEPEPEKPDSMDTFTIKVVYIDGRGETIGSDEWVFNEGVGEYGIPVDWNEWFLRGEDEIPDASEANKGKDSLDFNWWESDQKNRQMVVYLCKKDNGDGEMNGDGEVIVDNKAADDNNVAATNGVRTGDDLGITMMVYWILLIAVIALVIAGCIIVRKIGK